MKIPINLASQPFRRDRAVIVASLAVSVVMLISLGILITLAIADRNQMGDVRRDLARLNRDIRDANKTHGELEATIRQPANAEVLERSVFINQLLYRKGISWTRLLNDLEKTLPHNVRVLQIRPYVTDKNQITLDLMVGAENPEHVNNFYKALEHDALDHLREATRIEPLNADAWRLLSIAYGRQGQMGDSALALAEAASARGEKKEARLEADRAQQKFPYGSPGYLRAQDIRDANKSTD